jgi:hypothetical protein
MSWIERVLEERLAQAAADGELSAPRLEGKPLADLHWERPQGWWAQQFVQRELSHDRRVVAVAAAASSQAGFWRCADVESVRDAVRRANDAIARANVNMVDADRLPLFGADDIVERWRRLRR